MTTPPQQGLYYVIAEYPASNWVQNLQANPQVQVRVGQRKFPARARILSGESDSEIHAAIKKLSEKKYGWGEGLIVELIPAQ